MNTNTLNERCLFGDTFMQYPNYNPNINKLGQFCGIDYTKIYALADSERYFLSRITDILLIDGFGRMVNRKLGVSEYRRREFEESQRGTGEQACMQYARKDIFRRKCATICLVLLYSAGLYSIRMLTSIALSPQLVISLFVMSLVSSSLLQFRESMLKS